MMHPAKRQEEASSHQVKAPEIDGLLAVLRDFGLESCQILGEDNRVLNAAPQAMTPFMEVLTEVAPTMALLPECRSLHLNHLRGLRPELSDDEVMSSVLKVGGRRFFICAAGPGAETNKDAIVQAVAFGS